MVVIAYKWGGIAFDDKSLIKTLILPSAAKDDVPITFHNDAGANYQVPAGKVFIVGKVMLGNGASLNAPDYARIGESATADGAISKEVINLSGVVNSWSYEDVIGVYAAGKYVTAETASTTSGHTVIAGTTLYGVEIPA